MGWESDCFYIPVNCLETCGKGNRLFLHPSKLSWNIWDGNQIVFTSQRMVWTNLTLPSDFSPPHPKLSVSWYTQDMKTGERDHLHIRARNCIFEISFWGYFCATCGDYLFEHIYHGISVWTLYTMVWLFEHVYNGIFFWTVVPWYVYLHMYAMLYLIET